MRGRILEGFLHTILNRSEAAVSMNGWCQRPEWTRMPFFMLLIMANNLIIHNTSYYFILPPDTIPTYFMYAIGVECIRSYHMMGWNARILSYHRERSPLIY